MPMTDTKGVLQLRVIPPFVKTESRMIKTLFKSIRDVADRDGGRDIPTEDEFRSIMTYLHLDNGW